MAQWRLYDYPASANCYKVRLALAQLAADYERVLIDIFGGDTLTDAYAEINPARETPVLEVDGHRRLYASGAILAYVAEGSPLLPEDGWLRAQALRWLLFEQTAIMWNIGGLRFRLLTGRLAADDADAIRRRDGASQALRLLEHHLRGPFAALSDWLARVAAQPNHMNDLEPYPPNASQRAGLSIYG